MRVSAAEIQGLAERIVEAILQQGNVKPKVDAPKLVQRVKELMIRNLEEDAALEEEAERMADVHSRQMAGMDHRRVVQLIKQKLADERGFAL